MSRVLLVVLLLGLLIAVAGSFFLLGEDASIESVVSPSLEVNSVEDSLPRDVAPLDVAADEVVEELRVAELVVTEAPAIEAASTPAPTRLSGRVVREDGSPVGDVLVEFGIARETLVATDPTRTDADGRFALEFEGAVQLASTLVGAGVDTGALRNRDTITLDAGEQREITLTVGRGASLSGRVENADGLGLAGARVSLWSRSRWEVDKAGEPTPAADRVILADENGRFHFAAVGAEFVIAAALEGWVCTRRLLGELEPDAQVSDMRLLMEPEVLLEGVVLNSAGAGVSEAEVRLDTSAGMQSLTTKAFGIFELPLAVSVSTTDATGRFSTRSAAIGWRGVRVSHAAYKPLETQVDFAGGPVELFLARGGVLRGTVYGLDGAPLSGVKLRVNVFGTRRTSSEADGSYVMSGLEPRDTATLMAHAPGHAVFGVQPVLISDGEETILDVYLEPELFLGGVLQDLEGEPLAHATMSVEGTRVVDTGAATMFPTPTYEWSLGVSQTSTDAEGRFRFNSLYPGAFKLGATHPDDQALRVSWPVTAGDEDLVMVLDPDALPGVSFRGFVRDAQTGEPIEDFSLTPMRVTGSGASGSARSFSDPQGYFQLGGVEPGTLYLSANAAGYSPTQLPQQDYVEGLQELTIELSPTRSLHLRAVDPEGVPLEGLRLGFEDAKGKRLMVPVGPNSRSSALPTDAQGEALAQDLPAETITVVAQKQGFFRDIDPRFEFDLWDPLEGVQTIVVGESEVPPKTARVLAVGMLSGAAGIDPIVGPEQQMKELLETQFASLAASGALQPALLPFTLVFRPEVGDTVVATHEQLPNGSWSFLVDDEPPELLAMGAFVIEIPFGAGRLLLSADGKPAQSVDIEAGEVDLLAMFLFK